MSRPPFPPFNLETARQKVRMAEDAWNSRDPVKVSLAYTAEFGLAQSLRISGRPRGDRGFSHPQMGEGARL